MNSPVGGSWEHGELWPSPVWWKHQNRLEDSGLWGWGILGSGPTGVDNEIVLRIQWCLPLQAKVGGRRGSHIAAGMIGDRNPAQQSPHGGAQLSECRRHNCHK